MPTTMREYRPKKSNISYPYWIKIVLKEYSSRTNRAKVIRVHHPDIFDEGDHFTLIQRVGWADDGIYRLIRVDKSEIKRMYAEVEVDFMA